jgi:hypothetical protein
MKWFLLLYGVLILNLTGCQNVIRMYSTVKTPHNVEQLSVYGAEFADEYSSNAKETCTKYKQLYQEGDWSAGWILALQVTGNKNKHCLNSKQAIQILTRLKSEKKINPELLWLTQLHLSWLTEQEQKIKEVSQLKSVMSLNQALITELETENQDLVEKLEALKAIETSINQ